jgi:nitroreductase
MTTSPEIETAVRKALELATAAPSVHNSQPWQLTVAGDAINVYADFGRQLHVLDPTARQLLISCGSFLNHLEVALRGLGFDALVTCFPDDARDLVATVLVRPGNEANDAEKVLAAAIPERHSQREPFDNRPVPADVLDQLRGAAEREGAWLALVHEPDDKVMLAVLLAHADSAELDDPAYREEVANWRRTVSAADGIPASALPADVTHRQSDVRLRDFAVDAEHQPDTAPLATDVPGPAERPALVILGTDADTPAQWLTAGRALSRMLLTATGLGLRASMLGQVVDLPSIRAQLRTMLRLVGQPQMVLRLGYGAPGPATPRRAVVDMLRR